MRDTIRSSFLTLRVPRSNSLLMTMIGEITNVIEIYQEDEAREFLRLLLIIALVEQGDSPDFALEHDSPIIKLP